MLTPGLLRDLRVSAKLKSHPLSANRSTPTNSIDLLVAPLDAVDALMIERFQLDTPLKNKQTFAYTDKEIKQGMVLEVDSQEYNLRGVAAYPDMTGGWVFYQLILESTLRQ